MTIRCHLVRAIRRSSGKVVRSLGYAFGYAGRCWSEGNSCGRFMGGTDFHHLNDEPKLTWAQVVNLAIKDYRDERARRATGPPLPPDPSPPPKRRHPMY